MAGAAANAAAGPILSFAVVTDVHFADLPSKNKRDYRGSWERMARIVDAVNKAKPAFTIQLGDLVDNDRSSLSRILPVYDSIHSPRYHLLGNHDFPNSRGEVLQQLGLKSSWYDFALDRWRFVILDGMDLSVAAWPEGSPQYAAGAAKLSELRARRAANAQNWNGGLGDVQLSWLRGVLGRAREDRERVIVFCHLPALAESSTPQHVAWNCDEFRAILDDSRTVQAYLNGHDHNGGYAEQNGIHYVTFPGMVESGTANSFTLVDVFDDRLELRGTGTAPSRTLALNRGRR